MIALGPAGRPISFKGPFLSCLPFLKDIGLNAVEVQFVRNIWMKDWQAKEFGKEAKRLEIRLSVHAPYFINLCSPKKEILDASKKRILESCRLAELMGATHVVFHPGYYGKLSEEEAYKKVKNALEELSKNVRRVLIAPETMGNKSKFGSEDELIKIAKEVKNVTVTIDFAHLHARYNGLFKSKEDFIKIFEKFERELGKNYIKSFHSHFTCVNFDSKGERSHLPLKAKQPDFKLLAEALKELGINDCTIISESPILEKDSLEMKKILSELGFKF